MLEAFKTVVRNGSFILFLILQLLCFFWVVKYNQKQSQIFFYSLQVAAQATNARVKDIVSYFSLKDKMKELKEENANLLKDLKNIQEFLKKDSLAQHFKDSSVLKQNNHFNIISAAVVNNSISRKNNYLTIDKGSLDGVNPGMGVISSKGVAGIVMDTGIHYSIVMSLLHSNSRLSAKLKRSGFFGTLVWRDFDPRYVYLEEIQKYADVQVGDTVVTSGHSIIFPEGIPIGDVILFGVEPGAFTYTMKVRLFQSFSSLKSVYLIDHKYNKEKQSLEKRRIEDE
ncbi:MAG: rod shape-determining protein MreC [Saprospiraceae bacterium]|nr:rod shape-determining protein MreC [Saprospiraceae bacterium]